MKISEAALMILAAIFLCCGVASKRISPENPSTMRFVCTGLTGICLAAFQSLGAEMSSSIRWIPLIGAAGLFAISLLYLLYGVKDWRRQKRETTAQGKPLVREPEGVDD